MNKKIIVLVSAAVLIFAVGGFFWWNGNQKDVRELNKNLPKGVRVVKSLFGEEYKVVNKIDGYEFRVPGEWRGVKEVAYTSERIEEGYTFDSIELEGKEGAGRIIGLNRFQIEQSDVNLEEWAKNSFEISGLKSDFSKDKIGKSEIIKTKEQIGIIGYVYFFKKNLSLYTLTGGSEEFIREIIFNGKW